MIVKKITRTEIVPAAKILNEAYVDSLREATKHIQSKMKKGECFVAIDRNTVIGVFCYARDYSHYANYLEDIAVLSNYRRAGVASRMLKKYIEVSEREQSKKQRIALSSTDVNNKKSIKMHLKAGFKKIGKIRKIHYGRDEIIFGYSLRISKKR